MGKKVKIAVFDKDQTVKLEQHELSKSGNKIDIVSGGEGYFMPEIGPTKFLYWPIRKRFLFFGKHVYERIYFALKKGVSCIDFARKITILDEETHTGAIVYGPDEEALKESLTNLLATKIGKDAKEGIPWQTWAILGSSVLNLLFMLQMSGVLR